MLHHVVTIALLMLVWWRKANSNQQQRYYRKKSIIKCTVESVFPSDLSVLHRYVLLHCLDMNNPQKPQ